MRGMLVPRMLASVAAQTVRLSTRRPLAQSGFTAMRFMSTQTRSNIRRVGQEKDAGALQNLLKRVMEVDAGMTDMMPAPFTPHTYKCRAYCTAEEYQLSLLEKHLSSSSTFKVMPLITPDILHIQVDPSQGGGEMFVFSNGTFVAWGVQENCEQQFLQDCIRKLPGFEIHSIQAIETEDAEYVIDEDEATDMKGEVILLNPHIPSLTLSRISFSHGLARSAKLSVLESMLENYLSSTKHIPILMLQGKKIPLTRREILMKVGELLSFRQQLNLSAGESFLDTPDFYWARPELEEYYHKISRHLDVRPRIAILNKKLDYANELASILKEHLSEKHSLTLEWMIIILITVEVTFEAIHWVF
ncbi:uncharacterized protein BYT42DRAFT_558110 [Radiomyces spectabilis]|uniref:uncharacterized protein n=1 Tax=Radiomyces spectabilis TaxID=64574 RepID=UPI00221F5C72|nr:uncharacterized protein BYT42DRAFT_558110 [Radiomyces spectabilis]KAI8391797.1 hypothetical protein BYT42DRAFT_558110 [Radiomyces spectabilis]